MKPTNLDIIKRWLELVAHSSLSSLCSCLLLYIIKNLNVDCDSSQSVPPSEQAAFMSSCFSGDDWSAVLR